MPDQAIPAEPGWKVVKRLKDKGPELLEVLYWVHRTNEDIVVLCAMTPRGVLPTTMETERGWCFLRRPDGQHYLPGETRTYDREAVERWIEERQEAK